MARFKRFSQDEFTNENFLDNIPEDDSLNEDLMSDDTIKTQTITKDDINKANEILRKYQEGKKSIEQRIISNEQWWRMRHWDEMAASGEEGHPDEIKPASAWLFNCLMSKYSDYMESYPEPNILAREEGDQEEARRLSSVIPVVLEQADFKDTYSDEQWYKLKNGTGCYGVFWDGKKNNGLGDIAIKKVDMLNLYWEPGIQDIQDSANVFLTSMVDKEGLLSRYPEIPENSLGEVFSQADYERDDTFDKSEKALVVDWYYKRIDENGDTKLHYVQYVADTILYATENNELADSGLYDHGMYPFVIETMFPIESSICGLSYIDICKEPQKYIDRLHQGFLKNALMGALPRYLMRGDGNINEEEFADWRKQIVHADGNLGEDSLRQINVSGIDGNYMNLLEMKINEMKDTTGNTDVANGNGVPSGVTAASAIAAMQEAAGKTSRSQIEISWRAYKKLIYFVIELIRQFYDMPRQFRIIGQQGQMEYIQYDNSQIKPQEQGDDFGIDMGLRKPLFDVEVSVQKQTTYSKMEQNELALNFFKLGFYNPQMSDQAIACLETMDFEHKEDIIQRIARNGTMFEQIQQMQMQMNQMAMMLDGLTGGNAAGNTAMANAQNAQQPMPNGSYGDVDMDVMQQNKVVQDAKEQAYMATQPR